MSRARNATHERARGLENPRRPPMRRAPVAQTRDTSERQLLTTNHNTAATLSTREYQGDRPSILLRLCAALRARPRNKVRARMIRARINLTRSRHIRGRPLLVCQ